MLIDSGQRMAGIEKKDRPREKAIAHGFKGLTDAELMAIIFGTGTRERSVLDLCSHILSEHHGHLSLVMEKSVSELTHEFKGVGQAKAVALLAALELGARAVADAKKRDNPMVVASNIAYDIMRHHFVNLDTEHFWVMFLDRGAHVVKEIKISEGGVGATVVDPKVIMRHGILNLASSMILFHNHPSGTLRPSAEDDNLTNRIKKAAATLDMRVNDHLIITNTGYYSYADQGRI